MNSSQSDHIWSQSMNMDFGSLLERLSQKARDDYYNPYLMFDWPESLPDDQFWMSPELLSVYGTDSVKELDVAERMALSRWESINFYSLNVHGIRELLVEVTLRIHRPGFETPSEFFHHFIGEENDHMWFFAKFCNQYGGKIYPAKVIKLSDDIDPSVGSFLVFARILVFEQIVDYYNLVMANDERLHPTIRQINRIHHRDESRHIAFGAALVRLLWQQVLDSDVSAEARRDALGYVRRYVRTSIEQFYNPSAYRDAGISDGFALRQRLLKDPARGQVHSRVLRKTTQFLDRLVTSDPLLTEASPS